MKVLAVIHYPIYGGPQNQVAELDAALRERAVTTTVLLPDEPGNSVHRLADRGIEVRTMPLGRIRLSRDPRLHWHILKNLRGDVRRLRSAIRVERPDVVLLPGLANPQGALAAGLEGIAVVWQIVDTRVPEPARSVLMQIVRRRADCVMFWGDAVRTLHVGRRALTMPEFLAASPVDLRRFAPSAHHRAAVRRELDIPGSALVVGQVGNLNPQKGTEYFVAAAREIARVRPETFFVVVGARMPTHRAYVAEIEQAIAAAPELAGRFQLLEARTDVHRVMAAMDLLLITSVPASEGLPTVALEAMASGLPVVTTDVGSAAEAVQDGVTGRVVPPRDARQLERAVLEVLDSPDHGREMGLMGRRRVKSDYALERIADLHVEAFTAAVDHRRLQDGTRG